MYSNVLVVFTGRLFSDSIFLFFASSTIFGYSSRIKVIDLSCLKSLISSMANSLFAKIDLVMKLSYCSEFSYCERLIKMD